MAFAMFRSLPTSLLVKENITNEILKNVCYFLFYVMILCFFVESIMILFISVEYPFPINIKLAFV